MVQPSGGSYGTLQYQDVLLGERISRTYAEIIKSKYLLKRLLAKLGYPSDFEKLPFNVSVIAVRDSQLIKIGIESEDPKLAAEAANILAQLFIEDQAQKQAERFGNLKSSIEAQIAHLEEDIRKILEQKNEIKDQDSLRILDQQLITLQDMRTRLLAQLYELGLTEVRYTDVINQIQKAEIPKDPIKPNKLLNTIIGGVLGIIVATVGAFAAEYLDTKIKEPDQIQKITGLPVLGNIFQFEPDLNSHRNPYIAIDDRWSLTAESFRILRENLEFIQVDRPVQVLAITSPGPGEGKTFVALNLALAMAQSGKKVALVDADLYFPKIHQVFGFPRTPGLSDALIDKVTLRKFDKGNLIILTSGRLVPNPTDLLGSQQMGKLVASLKEMADVVIVDTPPFLGGAAVLSLGKWVDGFLMVATWGKTDRSAFLEAVKLARQNGFKVLGAVLNKVTFQARGYYYYYYYSEHKKPRWKKLFGRRLSSAKPQGKGSEGTAEDQG
jgi:non-specific protein-tyrosine kinase